MLTLCLGFTAWSSEREPAQVFVLLETIYRAMDKAAKRMNVFKVETIGDCYVAATGLPEPQEDHAERMAKFARKCLKSVAILTKRLEARLGPGTADLAMRIGIHSGPVRRSMV
jgi:class 3 adenylate cyclase